VRRPRPAQPPTQWQHLSLWEAVRYRVLPQLPLYFRSTIQIGGISATEIYTFGTALSAAIEEEVVRVLNDLRDLWDPQQQYRHARFERQAQRFPDVLLIDREKSDILFGIELKSWYLLAKEGEPSFRFTVTPKACSLADLLVIVPWAISYVVAGTPVMFEPFIESARYVAEYRNYWWQHMRRTDQDTAIHAPADAKPYPEGREQIADVPTHDPGRNFGRIARIGLMDAYIQRCMELSLLGISIRNWHTFFKQAGRGS
jgi:hypothetical protein